MSVKNKNSSVLLRKVVKSEDVVTLGQVKTENNILNQEELFASKNTIDSSGQLFLKNQQENILRAQELVDSKAKYEVEYKKAIEIEKLRLKKLHDQQLGLLENQFKSKINSLNNCITEFKESLKDLNSSVERISVEVIDSILEKIVFNLSGHENFIVEIIKKAIYQHNLDDGFTLKVSLHDFEMMSKIIEENNTLEPYKILLAKDSSLKNGQFVVDLNNSMIDIGFNQQITKARQLLNG